MRVAVDVTTALNVFPEREAADGENVEHVFNAFVVGLVIYNHDCFHKAMLCFCVMYDIVLGENMVGCDVVMQARHILRRARLVVKVDVHEYKFLAYFFLAFVVATAVEGTVEDGDDKEGDKGGYGKTTDDNESHGSPHL